MLSAQPVAPVDILRGFVGIIEAAYLADASENAVRAWCDRGLVRAIRDPVGRRLVDKKSLLEFVERRRRERAGE